MIQSPHLMKCLAMVVLALGVNASCAVNASADPLDWTMAIDTGGVWTTELGRDQPGEVRALIGRTSSGRHNRYSVNLIINSSERIELFDAMGDEVPKVSLISGRIVVKMTTWPTGATNPVENLACFGWNATSRTYQSATCP